MKGKYCFYQERPKKFKKLNELKDYVEEELMEIDPMKSCVQPFLIT